MKFRALTLGVAMLVIAGVFFATGQWALTAADAPADVLKKADEAFDKKNYKDAYEAYEAFLKLPGKPGTEGWQTASMCAPGPI